MSDEFHLPQTELLKNDLKVFDAVVDAGRKDLALRTAPCLSNDLNDLLQGTAHSVEHSVFVDPRRLTIRVPQASLQKKLDVKGQHF